MNRPIPTVRLSPIACRVDQTYEPILEIAARNRRPGENLLETLERMAVNEALTIWAGRQIDAAKALGVGAHRMNDLARNLCLRPMDAGPLPANWNRPGPKGRTA